MKHFSKKIGSRFDENELPAGKEYLARSGTPWHVHLDLPRWNLLDLFPEGKNVGGAEDFGVAADDFLNGCNTRMEVLQEQIESLALNPRTDDIVVAIRQSIQLKSDILRATGCAMLLLDANPGNEVLQRVCSKVKLMGNSLSLLVDDALLPFTQLPNAEKGYLQVHPDMMGITDYLYPSDPRLREGRNQQEAARIRLQETSTQVEAEQYYYETTHKRQESTPDQQLNSCTNAMNAVVSQAISSARDRNYPSPLHKFCHANEVPFSLVMQLMAEAPDHYKVNSEGYDNWALNADDSWPIGYAPGARRYSWDRAKDLLIEAMGTFHPEMEDIARRAVSENWIHAVPSPGKRAVAYSCVLPYYHENAHPYFSMSYNGSIQDLVTLAHEFGHMAANYFSAKDVKKNNFSHEMIHECYAKFASRVMMDTVLKHASPLERMELRGVALGDSSVLYYDTARTRFFHTLVNQSNSSGGRPLSTEDINEVFASEIGALRPNSKREIEWATTDEVRHIYLMSPYYNLTYPLSELLAGAVWEQWSSGGPETRRHISNVWVNMQQLGNELDLQASFRILGVDLNDRDLVKRGFERVDQAQRDFSRDWHEMASKSEVGGWRQRIWDNLLHSGLPGVFGNLSGYDYRK